MTDTRVQYHLRNHIPGLIDLVGNFDFPWVNIDKLILKQFERRKSESNGQVMMVEANVYDMIVSAKKGNNQAIGMLDFLNNLLKGLTEIIDDTERKLIVSVVKKVLTSLDKNYLNFVGEIATLNKFKKRGFYLEDVEFQLPNGKSIDFLVSRHDSDRMFLVEVFSIHIDETKVESDNDKIRTFLTKRLVDKNADKLKGLTSPIYFTLVPVLWGSYNALIKFNQFFVSQTLDVENASEPLCYIMQTDNQGYYQHSFGTIQATFKTIKANA